MCKLHCEHHNFYSGIVLKIKRKKLQFKINFIVKAIGCER